MNKEKYSTEQIAGALIAASGLISAAAKKLGCDRDTIYARIKKSKKLQKLREDLSENVIDLAEAKLIEKIGCGDLGAICFFLKCKGKKRGYVERQEVTGADGGPVSVTSLLVEDSTKLLEVEQQLREQRKRIYDGMNDASSDE